MCEFRLLRRFLPLFLLVALVARLQAEPHKGATLSNEKIATAYPHPTSPGTPPTKVVDFKINPPGTFAWVAYGTGLAGFESATRKWYLSDLPAQRLYFPANIPSDRPHVYCAGAASGQLKLSVRGTDGALGYRVFDSSTSKFGARQLDNEITIDGTPEKLFLKPRPSPLGNFEEIVVGGPWNRAGQRGLLVALVTQVPDLYDGRSTLKVSWERFMPIGPNDTVTDIAVAEPGDTSLGVAAVGSVVDGGGQNHPLLIHLDVQTGVPDYDSRTAMFPIANGSVNGVVWQFGRFRLVGDTGFTQLRGGLFMIEVVRNGPILEFVTAQSLFPALTADARSGPITRQATKIIDADGSGCFVAVPLNGFAEPPSGSYSNILLFRYSGFEPSVPFALVDMPGAVGSNEVPVALEKVFLHDNFAADFALSFSSDAINGATHDTSAQVRIYDFDDFSSAFSVVQSIEFPMHTGAVAAAVEDEFTAVAFSQHDVFFAGGSVYNPGGSNVPFLSHTGQMVEFFPRFFLDTDEAGIPFPNLVIGSEVTVPHGEAYLSINEGSAINAESRLFYSQNQASEIFVVEKINSEDHCVVLAPKERVLGCFKRNEPNFPNYTAYLQLKSRDKETRNIGRYARDFSSDPFLSQVDNGQGAIARITTTVDGGSTAPNRAPRFATGTFDSILLVPVGTNASFSFPAVDSDPGDVITYRFHVYESEASVFPPVAEAPPAPPANPNDPGWFAYRDYLRYLDYLGALAAPAEENSLGLSVNSVTGQVTWNTQLLGAGAKPYILQLVAEDHTLDAFGHLSPPKSSVACEFQVILNTPAQPNVPQLQVSQTQVVLPVGFELQSVLAIRVTDLDPGSRIFLDAVNLPPGATLDKIRGPAPLTSSLNFTPTQIGNYTFTLTARDEDGNASAPQVINLSVVPTSTSGLTAPLPEASTEDLDAYRRFTDVKVLPTSGDAVIAHKDGLSRVNRLGQTVWTIYDRAETIAISTTEKIVTAYHDPVTGENRVMCYNSNGTQSWISPITWTSHPATRALPLKLDGSNNIYFGSTVYSIFGDLETVIFKYGIDQSLKWQQTVWSPLFAPRRMVDLSVTPTGDLFVLGVEIPGAGSAFIAKVLTGGSQAWSRALPGGANVSQIEVDAAGISYVSGLSTSPYLVSSYANGDLRFNYNLNTPRPTLAPRMVRSSDRLFVAWRAGQTDPSSPVIYGDISVIALNLAESVPIGGNPVPVWTTSYDRSFFQTSEELVGIGFNSGQLTLGVASHSYNFIPGEVGFTNYAISFVAVGLNPADGAQLSERFSSEIQGSRTGPFQPTFNNLIYQGAMAVHSNGDCYVAAATFPGTLPQHSAAFAFPNDGFSGNSVVPQNGDGPDNPYPHRRFTDVKALSPGGDVIVAHADGLSRVRRDGSTVWTVHDKAASLAISSTGKIVAAHHDANTGANRVMVYNANGTAAWSSPVTWNSYAFSYPLPLKLDASDNIYFGSTYYAGQLGFDVWKYALDRTFHWHQAVSSPLNSSPKTLVDLAVTSGGDVILLGIETSGSGNPFIAKFNTSGTQAWSRSLSTNLNVGQVEVDGSGRAYVTSSGTANQVISTTDQGFSRWSATLSNVVQSSPPRMVLGDGKVYVACRRTGEANPYIAGSTYGDVLFAAVAQEQATSTATPLWQTSYDPDPVTASSEEVYGIALGPPGQVVVGAASNSLTFNPAGSGTTTYQVKVRALSFNSTTGLLASKRDLDAFSGSRTGPFSWTYANLIYQGAIAPASGPGGDAFVALATGWGTMPQHSGAFALPPAPYPIFSFAGVEFDGVTYFADLFNPGATTAQTQFEWGPNLAALTVVAGPNVLSNTTQHLSTTIAPPPHTRYFARWRASNEVGIVYSAVLTQISSNAAPVAVNDSVAWNAGFQDIAVLANDSDADDLTSTLEVKINSYPNYGTVDVLAGGLIRYTPFTIPSGPDSFRYTITDGFGGTAFATVTIQTPPPSPPTGLGNVLADEVALTGDAVPGEPAGTTFVDFSTPSINDNNQLAFIATINDGVPRTAIVAGDPLRVMARNGQNAAGLPAGFTYLSFQAPALNANGRIAFWATLAGPGMTASDIGLWTNAFTDNVTLVTRRSLTAPGTGNATFDVISEGVLDADALFFKGELTSGSGSPAVTASNKNGIWCHTSAGTTLVLRQGQTISLGALGNDGIGSFVAMGSLPKSSGQGMGVTGGVIPVRATMTSGRQTLLLVASDGDILPLWITGLGGSAVPGLATDRFETFGDPRQNSDTEGDGIAGGLAFVGNLTLGVGTTTASNNAAIFVENDEQSYSPSLLVRKGGPTGIASATFSSFEGLVKASGRNTAFVALLAGAGVTTATDLTLWWYDPFTSTLRLLGREGGGLAAIPSAKWLDFSSIALPDGVYSRPLFVGTLQIGFGGVTAANDVVLCAVEANGAPRILLREGASIGGRTVASFAALPATAGFSHQQDRNFNVWGDVVVQVTYTNGNQGILVIPVDQ
jgi:hypothetical protein